MIFAPHILQIKVTEPPQEDEYGKIVSTGKELWKTLGRCRCDDVSADKKVSVNGILYDYKYKVVYESKETVAAGTCVRCMNADGSVRGEGVAKSPMQTNYFQYKQVWLE